MRRRVRLLAVAWLALAAVYQAGLTQARAAAPDWAGTISDIFSGREWNAGEMMCARTLFSVRDGVLTGHYWIGDSEPFEGELTGFVAAAGHSGHFTWTDRFGAGVMFVRFSEDGQSFISFWGDEQPDTGRPGYGLRNGSVPGCGGVGS